MSKLSVYDENAIRRLTQLQISQAWDLEKSFDWSSRVDLNKPLVPLDQNALLFPGASQEQRLVISQMMGLTIAACICEMEECLLRLKQEGWADVMDRHPVSPEFKALGEQFFVEEQKHSTGFRRYMTKFAAEAGVDLKTLLELLPVVERSKSEAILRRNLKQGGQAFWWIVAVVEQEFLLLYHAIHPFKDEVEPLFYELHEKHFEEEARHAPFPYLMLELLQDRAQGIQGLMHARGDLVFAQILQAAWTLSSLSKIKKVKDLAGVHPLFDTMASVYPLLEKQPPAQMMWRLFTSVPYFSSLINLTSHKSVVRFADRSGALKLPFPNSHPEEFVRYKRASRR